MGTTIIKIEQNTQQVILKVEEGGIKGEKGADGVGIPGGTTGQSLVKKSNADYDTEWKTTTSVAGDGDMSKATYDPNNVEANAFDMANMVESDNANILTNTERSAIASNTSKVGVTNEEKNTINSVTSSEPTGSDLVLNVVSLTQSEYDAGTPISTTFYIITDA